MNHSPSTNLRPVRGHHALLDEESRNAKAAKIVALLTDHVQLNNKRILEVGCGGGYLTQRLAETALGAARVCGVDTQDLRQATSGYEFTLVRDTSLPFEDGAFDVAISNHVIEHTGAIDAQLHHLQEIHRVLAPGGVCYLALPNKRFPYERHFRLPLLSQLPRRMASAYVRLARRGAYYDCDIPSPRKVRLLARTAGFDVEDVTLGSIAHFRQIERPRGVLRLALQLPRPLLSLGMSISPSKMYLLRASRRTEPDRRLVLVGPAPSTRGGIAQFNSQLARVLEEAGAQVDLITYRRLYPRFSRAGRQGPDPSIADDRRSGEALLVPWLPWTWGRANRYVRRTAPDGLVFQYWHPITAPCSWYIGRFARSRGIRTVFVCHNASPHEPFPLSKWLSALALREASQVLTLSDGVAEEVRTLVGRSVDATVISHPSYSIFTPDGDALHRVDEWRSDLNLHDAKMVLFFGNIRAYKGLADLIEAFAAVVGAIPAKLVVAGTFFDSENRYLKQVEHYGLSAHVRFLGYYIPDEDVAALFSLADLVVLPYRSASQSGVLPLAAMFKKPVVATTVGGIPHALGDRGRLVPPRNPPVLAKAIVDCLQDPPQPPADTTDQWDRWASAILRGTATRA